MTGRSKANAGTIHRCEASLDTRVSTGREFPDPLADWEELEPGLQERRSSAQARE